ncbi:hypothetical protein BRYFOR_07781 [Marvinbryantia formatexigens DSM 14469]|uniref:GerMN domain-containing protein n=1 Tax=Marvinbryantia formatexigens DSM 14469 TaxID=478749 RepID=C6LGM1_9FIRM|nr:GerMN domain-containing protein [Marvinbryantia formatexigens]EET60221.1 hypothetical protein BRYFOR_07781 [Marvinbryantia formatexigens DSM 14469]UWO24245.1 GerMN domain-containing protein [Marvinbryantia formatexigens DSM 14469]SDF57916.1 germination protein M [Marvinbryantia formatexigens]
MKRIFCSFLAVLLLIGMAGCAKKGTDSSGYQIYYTNMEKTRLATESYHAQAADTGELIPELLDKMASPSAPAEHASVLASGVEITGNSLSDGQLTVTFNEEYQNLDPAAEILLRAAVVMTMTQMQEVRTVVFHIGNDVLRDISGEPVGAMTASMFLNAQVGTNSYRYASLSLYFSNKEGNKLVREVRNVHYSSNTTLERVVMEQLLKGPMNSQLLPVLPEDVSVISITVEDNLCTLNLSKEFLSVRDDDNLQPEVTIYSIVNSLCDMLGVERVQFQVEGQTNVLYKESLNLTGPFHRNSALIETAESTEAEQDAKPSIGL